MNQLLRMLQDERQLNNVELDEAFQQQPPIMLRGVEPSVEQVVREPAVEQPQLLQEEIDGPKKLTPQTDEEYQAWIKEPGVVGSGRRTPEEMNALRGQEGIEPDKPKTILDELRELRQQSDKDLEHARTMDAMAQLINTLAPLHENRMRARAMRSAQSIGADPGKLNLPQMPTDSASKQLAERSQRIKDLLSQFQLESSLQPKPLSELDRAKIESEKAKAEKYRADVQKSSAKTGEDSLFDKEIVKSQVKEYQTALKNAEDAQASNELINSILTEVAFDTTGPIGQYFAGNPLFSKDAETLDRKFKQASLDKMTKMFSGMSKAVDSDSERKFFEQSQMNISNRPETNLEIALGAKAVNTRNIAEAEARRDYVNKHGSLKGYKSPIMDGSKTILVEPNGNMILVDKTEASRLKEQEGLLTVDQFKDNFLKVAKSGNKMQTYKQYYGSGTSTSPYVERKGKTRVQMPDGQLFNVDSDKVEALMKKYPNAKIME